MTVDRSYSGQSTSNEHKMIDIQYEIQKLQADLEFHEQKIRLINRALEQKNSKMSTIMRRVAYLHRIRDRFAGDQNED
jgi:phage-related tail protein